MDTISQTSVQLVVLEVVLMVTGPLDVPQKTSVVSNQEIMVETSQWLPTNQTGRDTGIVIVMDP